MIPVVAFVALAMGAVWLWERGNRPAPPPTNAALALQEQMVSQGVSSGTGQTPAATSIAAGSASVAPRPGPPPATIQPLTRGTYLGPSQAQGPDEVTEALQQAALGVQVASGLANLVKDNWTTFSGLFADPITGEARSAGVVPYGATAAYYEQSNAAELTNAGGMLGGLDALQDPNYDPFAASITQEPAGTITQPDAWIYQD